MMTSGIKTNLEDNHVLTTFLKPVTQSASGTAHITSTMIIASSLYLQLITMLRQITRWKL